ncbi:MAG TPA: hypothetical protein VHA13_02280 [Gammaproteobacteria bacterium]|nr:hypothetical protein [Gammaproteobacteria bacterium]
MSFSGSLFPNKKVSEPLKRKLIEPNTPSPIKDKQVIGEGELKFSNKRVRLSAFFNAIKPNTQAAIDVHGEAPTLFEGQEYIMLNRFMPLTTQLRVSCRSSAKRENLLLDMQSTELKLCFDAFLKQIEQDELIRAGGEDEEANTQPLEEYNSYLAEIRKTDFSLKKKPYDLMYLNAVVDSASRKFKTTTELELKALVEAKQSVAVTSKETNALAAPLEWFVEFDKGYCRHKALFAAYLLCHLIEHLSQKNICDASKNKVYRYRTKLQSLADPERWDSHALVIFAAENGEWYLLDPSRNMSSNERAVFNLTDLSETDKEMFRRFYPHHDVDQFLENILTEYEISGNMPVPPPSPVG